MPNFMLLLHESPDTFAAVSPDDIQRVIEKYSVWRQSLASSGKLTGGEKLKDEGGKHLSKKGSEVRVVDGPFNEAKEVMGGFFMIEAEDYSEAVELARGCPHLEYGWVELREVDQVHG